MFESEEQFKYKEQELEDTLRMNERFSARYFTLLERFADLPACDELIMAQLTKEFPAEFLANLEAYEDKVGFESPEDFDDKALKEPNPWDEPKSGELPPEMKLLRQLDNRGRKIAGILYQGVFDWCNIQVILMPDEQNTRGLRVMFFQSRAMGCFNAAMEALSSHELHSSIVLCKRVMTQINLVITVLLELSKGIPANLKDLLLNRVTMLKTLLREVETQISDSRELARLEGQF
ncbi:MAG: hypothetical protein WCT05_02500 [Lentisphaeria bacterium]